MAEPQKRNIDLSKAVTNRGGAGPGARPQPGGQQQGARSAPQGSVYRAQQPAQRGAHSARASQGGASRPPQAAAPYRAAGNAPRQNAARGPAARPTSARAPQRSGAQPTRTANGSAPRRTAPGGSRTAQTARAPGRGASNQKKKKNMRRRVGITLLSICAVLALSAVGLNIFLKSLINPGVGGSIVEEIKTPPQLVKDQLSLLVVGIDFTEFDGREDIVRDPIGQTDMVLYLRFNLADNTLRMLQIPRDLFMGKDAPTGGTGKLNGLYRHGADEKNRINNIAVPISETLQLPIDGYVSIDMVSLREIVDVFGGIEVYVAKRHEYKGSWLDPGWQVMHGDMMEFFLRDRHSTATGDIGRLDNQRYFYSALFRRLRTATWKDIVKLTPVVQNYVNTDLSVTDCAALGIRMLKIPSSNIMMCRLPNFDSTENYNVEHAVQVLDAQGAADVLNEYFRTPETQVSAEQYIFADWPHAGMPHTANVQWMSDVDADGGGTVGEVADGAQTGDDLLNPPESGSASAPAA